MFRKTTWLALAALTLSACTGEDSAPAGAPLAEVRVVPASTVEAGCAGCVFSMEGAKGCELAVKIDGKAYLVTGVAMPGHESGLCDHAVKADVAGKLEGGRFVAESFALNP